MARPLRQLSPSSMRTYERCPYMYHLRYTERIQVPNTAAQLLGRAVHAVIEIYYKQKREGKTLDTEAAFDALDDALDATLHELDEEGRLEVDEMRELGYDLVEYYVEEVAPHIRPHLIEERFRFSVPGVDVPIVGYVDLVDQDGTVIDHKTASSPFPEDYLAQDVQLLTYSLGYNALRMGARQRPRTTPVSQYAPTGSPRRFDKGRRNHLSETRIPLRTGAPRALRGACERCCRGHSIRGLSPLLANSSARSRCLPLLRL